MLILENICNRRKGFFLYIFFYSSWLLSLTVVVFLLRFISRLLRVVYGPPEESDERQAQVTTLVNNLRNTEGDIETGPCGEH